MLVLGRQNERRRPSGRTGRPPSWEPRNSTTAQGTSTGSARKVPKNRTVVSCRENPSRLWSPRRLATKPQSVSSRKK